jgi:hypothetical protein
MVQHGGSARRFSTGVLTGVLTAALAAACSKPAPPPAATESKKPADAQHAGITTPHGDHTPHHGGLVMMGGDLHYEVVFDAGGRHRVWFSDAVREELPASVAKDVTLIVSRKDAAPETLSLAIDDAGESWVASGRPVSGKDVWVKVTFSSKGEPFEVEIPYADPARPATP